MPRALLPSKPSPPTAATNGALLALQTTTANREAYTILKISDAISSSSTTTPGPADPTAGARTSDVSTTSLSTPAALDADLAHYRQLFAKLRFSYVEQVTKEKFIRAIVGDPPLIVAPGDIAELEAENARAKAELKGLKVEVAGVLSGLEERGRGLARRWEAVRRDGERVVGELPGRIEAVEERVGVLKAEVGGRAGEGTTMGLPLGKTREVVGERRGVLEGLERQLGVVGGQVPRKRKEAERLRAEVAALEVKRGNCLAAAMEAKRRREDAQRGGEDELEARGRWERASEAVLREILGV